MKKNMLPGLLVVVAIIGQSASIASEPVEHRSRIAFTERSPFHQLVLPASVYRESVRDDLGDVRVFNRNGEAVPHSLLRSAIAAVRVMTLPSFPITAPKEAAGESMADVQRNSDGSLAAGKNSADARSGIVRGLIIDASAMSGKNLRSINLKMGPTNNPFHPMTIETSDDLVQWRLLRNNAQVVHIEYDGQRLDNETVEWEAETAKYLRVLWRAPQQAPTIREVSANMAQPAMRSATMQWSDPVSPSSVQPDFYEYVLPARMPLDRLRLALPQANTLTSIDLQRYEQAATGNAPGTWKSIRKSIVYRLQSPQGDVSSPDLVLNLPPHQHLRLKADATSGFGTTPPVMQAGFLPHVLVFADRGDGPFDLSWGAARISNTALPVDQLIADYRPDQVLAASAATLRPAATTAALPHATALPKPSPEGTLRLALLAGLLACAALVAAFIKRRDPTHDRRP